MHFVLPRILLLLPVLSLVLSSTEIAANESVLKAWDVLEGCRLLKTPVNDGDSFKLAHGGKEFIIRLYYVDCPETYDTYRERLADQARYFSISETEVILAGKAAKTYTQKFLKGEFTVITRWEDARGGEKMRYFGMIRRGNRFLSSELVRNGLARIYGMPTKGSWPGGFTPEAYLTRLKQNERAAQRTGKGIWGSAQNSNQLAGLSHIKDRAPTQLPVAAAFSANGSSGKLILNAASAADLDALPGIGPALAERIIAARPFTEVDGLATIPGISMKKVDALRDLVVLDKPPPPPLTVDFYLADSGAYLNQEVTVNVSRLTQSSLTAPKGFQAVHMETANQGQQGGSISVFIPEEYYDSFISYYQQPNRKFTGLLFEQDSNIVLVYRRK